MAFFVGISPTSKEFAIGKKIRYDRGNERLVREGIIKLSLSWILFQPFFLCYNRSQYVVSRKGVRAWKKIFGRE